MVLENIILEELNKLKKTNLLLLDNLDLTSKLITDKDTEKLRKHLEEQERLSILQEKNVEDLRGVLNSTHFKNLSHFISNTKNSQLISEYKIFKNTLYKVIIKSNLNKQLLEDCQRINNTRLNILIGRKQEPTNYNFSTQNINAHLLNKFKNNS